MGSLLLTAVYATLSLHAEPKLPPPANLTIDFARHVRPIFAEKCQSCHGPKQQQSGLRLDKRQNALRGGDYGPVIVPGKSAESKLILRVVSGDGGMQMPPTGPLSAEEIGILRAWIDQGAEFADVLEETKVSKRTVDPKVRDLIAAVRQQQMAAVQRLRQAARGTDAAGSTALHHAAGFGTVAAMKVLLDAGADGNAKNDGGATALHWAILDAAKVRLLLERGADIEAKTDNGSTALYLAATQRNGNAVLQLLLDKGAKADAATMTGRTPLMAAAAQGNVAGMKALLAKGANAKAVSATGSVALLDAAQFGSLEAVRLLLDAGVAVNARTKRNQSALAIAASQGAEDVVGLLLARGAEVNVQDERGYSPLMYAAYSEKRNPNIVRMLLDKGARRDVTGEDETPVTLAAKRGDTEVARLLGVPEAQRRAGGVVAVAAHEPLPIAEAVRRASGMLEAQSPNFVKRGGCNSCHNQSLPAAAFGVARQRGLTAPKDVAQLSLEMVEMTPERNMVLNAIAANSSGYQMLGFGLSGRAGDEYTDSVVHYLKALQNTDGYWHTAGNRPPLTSDHIQTTAMAIYALRTYSRGPQKADSDRRIARAAAWLESAKAETTQERAFQVLGLKWAGAKAPTIERAAKHLLAGQRADGGWAQLPEMGSDAYASGEALYALAAGAGVDPSGAEYQKGVQYLLRTQAADGTWHVKTRSLPVQPYFQSGFPYHHDQWISAAGTSWAILGLAQAAEPQRVSRR